jgi:hypothetical protein
LEAWTSRDWTLTNLSGGGAGVLALLAFDGGPGTRDLFFQNKAREGSTSRSGQEKGTWQGWVDWDLGVSTVRGGIWFITGDIT